MAREESSGKQPFLPFLTLSPALTSWSLRMSKEPKGTPQPRRVATTWALKPHCGRSGDPYSRAEHRPAQTPKHGAMLHVNHAAASRPSKMACSTALTFELGTGGLSGRLKWRLSFW